MSKRCVVVFDFVNKRVEMIGREEHDRRMREQYERGVRMTSEGFPPPAETKEPT